MRTPCKLHRWRLAQAVLWASTMGARSVAVGLLCAGCVADVEILGGSEPDVVSTAAAFGTKNATGFGDTFFAAGSTDPSNPFFASLGTNGRTCESCHVQGEGWTITPAGAKA